MPETPFKWLAVYLVYNNALYDEKHANDKTHISMEKQKDSLINSIQDTPFNPAIKIIIVELRTTRKRDGVEQKIHALEKTKSKRLEHISRPANFNISLVTKQSVVDILSYLKKQYYAERHILVTFGHGSILGVNLFSTRQDSEIPKKLFSVRQINDPFTDGCWSKHKVKFSGSIAKKANDASLRKRDIVKFFVEKKLDILSNRELAEALAEIFTDRKLDILVMYNCLMQNIFTQYEFRKSVDFLVAPESGISYPGYNWIGTFKKIGKNPSEENVKIASFFIETIRKERNHPYYPEFKTEVEGTWKVNAIQLDVKVFENIRNKFIDMMDEMLKLSKKSNDIFRCLRNVKRQLFKYSKFSLPSVTIVDLEIFLNYLPEALKGYNSLQSLIEKNESLKKSLEEIPQNFSFTGKNLYDDEFFYIDEDFKKLKKGIGIWLADKKPAADSVLNIFQARDTLGVTPSFVKGTAYLKFFRAFALWNAKSLNI